MAKRSEPAGSPLEGLLGLGNHSMRKHHYGELARRLEELEAERNRYRQLNDELERRVLARTEELRQARDAAEAANRGKDRYLAAASHDLLQPLNAARLLIATLRERPLADPERHWVERSHQALEGAEQLLGDLLDIARLDQDAVRPSRAPLALNTWLPALVAEFEPQARAKGLRLRLRPSAWQVDTDAQLLARILRNLISNACRYTAGGGVLVGTRRRGGRVQLQVWDTGCGIAAHQLQEVFVAFRQLHEGPTAERQGVGLGLAIVERMASVLEHPLTVRSRQGKGSVFSLELPLAPDPVAGAGGLPAVPGPQGLLTGASVLVVDNEPAILEGMAALLGQWGCHVRVALTAAEALAGPPAHVVVIDYHLGDGQLGTDLLRAMRERWGRGVAALFVTADRSDGCRQAIGRQQAPLLNKPAKPGKLRAALAALLASAG